MKNIIILTLIATCFSSSIIWGKEYTAQGIVRSLKTQNIAVPYIRGIQRMRLKFIIPEGQSIQVGDVLAIFESNTLTDKVYKLENQLKLQQISNQNAEKQAEEKITSAELETRSKQKRMEQKKLTLSKISPSYSRRYIEDKKYDFEIAKQDYKDAKRKLETLKSYLKIVKDYSNALYSRNLNRLKRMKKTAKEELTIYSPMKGIVVYKRIWQKSGWQKTARGLELSRGTPFVEILDPKNLYADVFFPEEAYLMIKNNQPAKVFLLSDESRTINGFILKRHNFITEKAEILQNWVIPDWDQLVFKAEVGLKDIPYWIKPNMNVKVTVE